MGRGFYITLSLFLSIYIELQNFKSIIVFDVHNTYKREAEKTLLWWPLVKRESALTVQQVSFGTQILLTKGKKDSHKLWGEANIRRKGMPTQLVGSMETILATSSVTDAPARWPFHFILHMRKLRPIHTTDSSDKYLLNTGLGIQYPELHSNEGSGHQLNG